MTEEDLIQNPHFSKLLLSLSQNVDESGLSLRLAKEQAQVRPLAGRRGGRRRGESLREKPSQTGVPFCFEAWSEVQLRKTAWLRNEILQRVIQELLVDYYVKAQDTTLTSEDKKVRPEKRRR